MLRNLARFHPEAKRSPFPRPSALAVGVVLAVSLLTATSSAQQGSTAKEFSIEAPALSGIKIDGKLSDWPPAIPRYSIRNFVIFPPEYGYNGLEDADLSTSPDLSAAFSVGYDPSEQVLYLGVIVRDDKLVIGHRNYLDSDAIEVYVDGLNSKKDVPFPVPNGPDAMHWWDFTDLSTMPVHQYVAIPSPGPVYGTKYQTNPILMAGDLKRTKTRMAFRREGDVTIYEWAIQPFDIYPDQPTRLEPGKRIGFDLAIVDRDSPMQTPVGSEPEEDRPAFIYWGPKWNGMKAIQSSTLGELVLGKGSPPPPVSQSSRSSELRDIVRELEELTEAQAAQAQTTARVLRQARQALEAAEAGSSQSRSGRR